MCAARASKKSVFSKVTFESLNKWNRWLAVVYALQGLVILILSTTRTIPVIANYLGVDTRQTQAINRTVFSVGSRHLFDLNLAYIVVAVLLMSAIAHAAIATKLRSVYEKDLKKNINKIRWFEYAFSASTILVVIGLLCGIYDFSSLLMIFLLGSVTYLIAFSMELRNQEKGKTDWLSCVIGGITGILLWIVFAVYLINSLLSGGSVPTYVYWIYATTLVLFGGMVANNHMIRTKQGRLKNYLYGETIYMILSLTMKAALVWQIFAGTLRP